MMSRRSILWMLALVVGLQGVSVGVAKARGPAHVHLEPARIVMLEDVRRSDHGASGGSPVSAWLAHGHPSSQRHHHAAADPTVVVDAVSAAEAAAEDGGLTLDLGAAAFIALLMLAWCWAPARQRPLRALRSPWQPSFATARLLDRPPQPA